MSEDKKYKYILETVDLTVRYNNIIALEKLNFSIKPGEVVGILGDNGAGKTTFVQSIIGIIQKVEGDILWKGNSLLSMNPVIAKELGIEIVLQDSRLFEELNIIQNIFIGREVDKRPKNFKLKDSQKMLKIVEENLWQFGITEKKIFFDPLKNLPGGLQQIIAFLRAYIFCSTLLILDEPIKGLDEKSIEIVLRLIRKISNQGIAVIFITHKAHEVFNIADRFIILKEGVKYQELNKNDTNLKELEQLLVYSRLNLVKELTASVSHQLKNPISIIRLFSEMLRDNFHVEEEQEKFIEIINTLLIETDKMDHVISNLIEYTKVPTIDKYYNDILQLVQSIVESLKKDNLAEIVINNKLKKQLFYLDQNIIRQVIENVLVNAIEASSIESYVEIILKQKNERLCIIIKDYGTGIDKKLINRIFNPYFTNKTNGTGLGLTIVERLIKEHGGTIRIESEKGSGTSVYISI